MGMLRNRLLVSVLVVGLMGLEAVLLATPARCSTPDDGPMVLIVADAGVAPVDPVVEEPLRPLLPDEQPCPSGLPARCGQVGALPLPVTVASILMLYLPFLRQSG